MARSCCRLRARSALMFRRCCWARLRVRSGMLSSRPGGERAYQFRGGRYRGGGVPVGEQHPNARRHVFSQPGRGGPHDGAVGELFIAPPTAPDPECFEQMVLSAQTLEIPRMGQPPRAIGDRMVHIAVHGGAITAREAAGGVAGAHEPLLGGAGPVPGHRGEIYGVEHRLDRRAHGPEFGQQRCGDHPAAGDHRRGRARHRGARRRAGLATAVVRTVGTTVVGTTVVGTVVVGAPSSRDGCGRPSSGSLVMMWMTRCSARGSSRGGAVGFTAPARQPSPLTAMIPNASVRRSPWVRGSSGHTERANASARRSISSASVILIRP